MSHATKIFFFVAWLILLPLQKICAQVYTINAHVRDKKTGEAIPFAKLKILESNIQIVADRFGDISFQKNLPEISVEIQASGYHTMVYQLKMYLDSDLTCLLSPWEYDLKEINIFKNNKLLINDEGNIRVSGKQVKELPSLLSEPDVLKSFQLLPGIQGGAEGTAGIHVRGGSEDQNLILMDGVPVYNVNHLFGFFSVFNPDMISSAELYKSDLPARYGGRLSSVMDITMREGNKKYLKGAAQLGVLSSKLLIEGPIKKDTSSFIFSARKSWIDVLASLSQRIAGNGSVTNLGFYDLNGKINYQLNKNNHIFVSAYLGQDNFKSAVRSGNEKAQSGFHWGNITSVLRWNHRFNPKFHAVSSASFTNFRYVTENRYDNDEETYRSSVRSGIKDLEIKSDMIYAKSNRSEIDFGVSFTNHWFRPEIEQSKGTQELDRNKSAKQELVRMRDIKFYGEGIVKVDKLSFHAGMNFNLLAVSAKTFQSLQPRVSAIYQISQRASLKLAYFKTFQYLHLLTNSSLSIPSDLWVPVTDKLKPEQANQISFGINADLNTIKFTVEGFSKQMKNLLDYAEGSSFFDSNDQYWYDRVVVGKGISKGLEFLLQKPGQKFNSFISYTLSISTRTFAELNRGASFPYKYDRRHVLHISSQYHFSQHKTVQFLFNISSGNHLTFPSSKYQGVSPPITTDIIANQDFFSRFQKLSYLPYRNNLKMPIYHRMDLNYRVVKEKKRSSRSWVFAIYNVYNKKNPFYLFEQKGTMKQFTLFPMIPSVSYELQF